MRHNPWSPHQHETSSRTCPLRSSGGAKHTGRSHWWIGLVKLLKVLVILTTLDHSPGCATSTAVVHESASISWFPIIAPAGVPPVQLISTPVACHELPPDLQITASHCRVDEEHRAPSRLRFPASLPLRRSVTPAVSWTSSKTAARAYRPWYVGAQLARYFADLLHRRDSPSSHTACMPSMTMTCWMTNLLPPCPTGSWTSNTP
jgi:hypothetical protein